MNEEKLKRIAELEIALNYLIDSDMTLEKKLKALSNSFWRSHNSGYCDHIAGLLMGGIENGETEQYDLDCKFKQEVIDLTDLLKEYQNEEWEGLWQKASDLFNEDNKAGYEAFLELSEMGYARAAHSVGWCLLNGKGVEADIEKAEAYYKLAIERGFYKSYSGLYWVYTEKGNSDDEAMEFLIEGARKGNADCYGMLASLCNSEKIFSGNPRVSAFLSTRAYELDKRCSEMLALHYMNGVFFPVVYPYAKYCLEKSDFTKEEFEECGVTFPEAWDDIEPIEPSYPDFGLTLDDCESATDPTKLIIKAEELIFADDPDNEGAKPYVLEAARAGYSHAMYYAYYISLDEWQDLLVKGADEYGDVDCIETLAILFTDNASFKIGDPYLNKAALYWNKRKKLHGAIPMKQMAEESHKIYIKGLDKVFGHITSAFRSDSNASSDSREFDPNANAVLLRADGSYERIKIDFNTLEGLYAPIGCDRLNIIATQKMRDISDELGFSVVMYCDERGMMKDLPENDIAAKLSGYDVIWGDVVVCGFDKDYAPFDKNELEDVCKLLDKKR